MSCQSAGEEAGAEKDGRGDRKGIRESGEGGRDATGVGLVATTTPFFGLIRLHGSVRACIGNIADAGLH